MIQTAKHSILIVKLYFKSAYDAIYWFIHDFFPKGCCEVYERITDMYDETGMHRPSPDWIIIFT